MKTEFNIEGNKIVIKETIMACSDAVYLNGCDIGDIDTDEDDETIFVFNGNDGLGMKHEDLKTLLGYICRIYSDNKPFEDKPVTLNQAWQNWEDNIFKKK